MNEPSFRLFEGRNVRTVAVIISRTFLLSNPRLMVFRKHSGSVPFKYSYKVIHGRLSSTIFLTE
jgi:hypothetical protein